MLLIFFNARKEEISVPPATTEARAPKVGCARSPRCRLAPGGQNDYETVLGIRHSDDCGWLGGWRGIPGPGGRSRRQQRLQSAGADPAWEPDGVSGGRLVDAQHEGVSHAG